MYDIYKHTNLKGKKKIQISQYRERVAAHEEETEGENYRERE